MWAGYATARRWTSIPVRVNFCDTPHGHDIRKRAINEAPERGDAREFAGQKDLRTTHRNLLHRNRKNQAATVSNISTRSP